MIYLKYVRAIARRRAMLGDPGGELGLEVFLGFKSEPPVCWTVNVCLKSKMQRNKQTNISYKKKFFLSNFINDPQGNLPRNLISASFYLPVGKLIFGLVVSFLINFNRLLLKCPFLFFGVGVC